MTHAIASTSSLNHIRTLIESLSGYEGERVTGSVTIRPELASELASCVFGQVLPASLASCKQDMANADFTTIEGISEVKALAEANFETTLSEVMKAKKALALQSKKVYDMLNAKKKKSEDEIEAAQQELARLESVHADVMAIFMDARRAEEYVRFAPTALTENTVEATLYALFFIIRVDLYNPSLNRIPNLVSDLNRLLSN